MRQEDLIFLLKVTRCAHLSSSAVTKPSQHPSWQKTRPWKEKPANICPKVIPTNTQETHKPFRKLLPQAGMETCLPRTQRHCWRQGEPLLLWLEIQEGEIEQQHNWNRQSKLLLLFNQPLQKQLQREWGIIFPWSVAPVPVLQSSWHCAPQRMWECFCGLLILPFGLAERRTWNHREKSH